MLWIQLFYIAAPSVPLEILPQNMVCVSYIKKQSIAHLFNKVSEAMNHGDPGLGIFTLGFNREVGELGTYYSVTFDWRPRSEEEEKQQLNIIAAFMSEYSNQLIDLEGTREMVCVDGWTAEQLQAFRQERQGIAKPQDQHSLTAA